MRLINVDTLDLEEFNGDQIPKYAILSHTWQEGEVTFQDWEDRHAASQMAGFSKIWGACQQAQKDSIRYLWVDTNCIDKKSSAELTEAINSMFALYRDAEVCYAFLVDVPAIDKTDPEPLRHFRKSRWFTRGWTLQELLTPREVVFFDQDWTKIGQRFTSLKKEIADITGIGGSFLCNRPVMLAPVAERMSWLSRRVTTRVEDMAYCVLGIFDTNMPLLYGEGKKAFIRLQEEIIKTSTDHTIFCWTWVDSVPGGWTSMLAPLPAAFKFSGSYFQMKRAVRPSTYSMTNAGLSIRLPIICALSYVFAILDAQQRRNQRSTRQVAIPLGRHGVDTYRRVPFPPGPTAYDPAVFSITRDLLVSSAKPRPNETRPISPQLPYGVLLTFGNVRPLVDPLRLSDSHIESENGYVSMEKGPYLGIETCPPFLFDTQRSLAMFTIDPDKTADQVAVTMVRLGSVHHVGCVLMLAIRVLASGKVLWFCDILPAESWHASERRRLELQRLLEAQVSGRSTGMTYARFAGWDLCLEIGHEWKVSYGAVVRPAHLFPRGEVLGFLSDEGDTGSNCATVPYRRS